MFCLQNMTLKPSTFVPQVDMATVISLRSVILSSGSDMHRPTDLASKMKAVSICDNVNRSLLMMLSPQEARESTASCLICLIFSPALPCPALGAGASVFY